MLVDMWCRNCQQNVRPKERHGIQTWAIGVVVWLLSGLLYNRIGWFGGYVGIATFVTALVIAPQFGSRYKIRRCPICGTNNLESARSTDVAEDAEGPEEPAQSSDPDDPVVLGQRIAAQIKAGKRSIGSLSREERRALIAYRRSQGGLLGAFVSGLREGRRDR